jgi:hypothetical protein
MEMEDRKGLINGILSIIEHGCDDRNACSGCVYEKLEADACINTCVATKIYDFLIPKDCITLSEKVYDHEIHESYKRGYVDGYDKARVEIVGQIFTKLYKALDIDDYDINISFNKHQQSNTKEVQNEQ